MNQTTDPGDTTGQTTGQTTEAPRLTRDRVQDLDQLRRSRSDRYVAGVAGGLGRHFDLDPTLIRVLLVVMSIFGGAGLLLYGVAWLLVPEEGRDRAVWSVRPDTRRVLLIGAAILGVLIVAGHAWGGGMWGGGWGAGWPIGVLVILGAVLLVSSGRNHPREDREVREPREDTAMTTPTATTQTLVDDRPETTGSQEPPSWTPPVTREPRPPRRPRRTGLLLFWPVVAAIALAEGLLGIWDIDHHVASGAWVALALAIVGIGLVVGAYVGRPGGLILIGLPLIPALIASSVLGGAHWETRTVTYTPTTSASLLSSYDITNGRLDLDLSSVSDPKALDGRNVDLSLGAGKITVELPPGTRAEVDAAIRYGGEIQVGNRDQSGFNSHLVTTVASAGAAADAPTVHLTIRARVGQIYIEGN